MNRGTDNLKITASVLKGLESWWKHSAIPEKAKADRRLTQRVIELIGEADHQFRISQWVVKNRKEVLSTIAGIRKLDAKLKKLNFYSYFSQLEIDLDRYDLEGALIGRLEFFTPFSREPKKRRADTLGEKMLLSAALTLLQKSVGGPTTDQILQSLREDTGLKRLGMRVDLPSRESIHRGVNEAFHHLENETAEIVKLECWDFVYREKTRLSEDEETGRLTRFIDDGDAQVRFIYYGDKRSLNKSLMERLRRQILD